MYGKKINVTKEKTLVNLRKHNMEDEFNLS